MNLIEAISWAVVEVSAAKPDLKAIRDALSGALEEAAKLEINHDVRRDSLIRLSHVNGGL